LALRHVSRNVDSVFEASAMAVPKRRTSKSKSKMRRSHMGLKPMKLQSCPQCGTFKPSHVVCPNCGNYQGRAVVEVQE
jgi:large subunit ribosomal protein L32